VEVRRRDILAAAWFASVRSKKENNNITGGGYGMTSAPLSGKRVAVLVESKFIGEEIEAYRHGFAQLGAEVDFVSRLAFDGNLAPSATFFSDLDPLDDEPWQSPRVLRVTKDLSLVPAGNYAALIMSANYTSVRLRWEALPRQSLAQLTDADISAFDARAHVQSPPAVRLFAQAMANKQLVKGALCHGLWLLTPFPELLKGRRVICHSVVMSDVLNCGAQIELSPSGVVVDDDLVTGFSKHEVDAFISRIATRIIEKA
jgi:protease I